MKRLTVYAKATLEQMVAGNGFVPVLEHLKAIAVKRKERGVELDMQYALDNIERGRQVEQVEKPQPKPKIIVGLRTDQPEIV